MKFFLIFILSFEIFACGKDSPSEINSCTLVDTYQLVLARIRPGEPYTIDPLSGPSDNRSLYQRLLMNNKPPLKEMSDDLDALKSEYLSDLQFRNRVKGVNDEYLRDSMVKCSLSGNPALVLKTIYRDKDDVTLSCLESKRNEVINETQLQLQKESSRDSYKSQIDAFDCTSLSGFANLVCNYIQLK